MQDEIDNTSIHILQRQKITLKLRENGSEFHKDALRYKIEKQLNLQLVKIPLIWANTPLYVSMLLQDEAMDTWQLDKSAESIDPIGSFFLDDYLQHLVEA